jgi:hypothetical protein
MVILRALLMTTLLACPAALALDLTRTDIPTLRLGVTRSDALDRLATQGYAATDETPSTIKVRTKDGWLAVGFTSGDHVDRIVYTFNGLAPNEGAIVRGAILDHYGEPSVAEPLAWCGVPPAGRSCPRDQPSLTFGADKDGKAVLTLSSMAGP